MTEHPILFSAPMIRAILEGRKTVTRRIIKSNYQSIEQRDDGSAWPWREDLDRAEDHWYPCPYGRPGDTLWVRETWAVPHAFDGHSPAHVPTSARLHYAATEDLGGLLKRPSIFMPRWASRITLRIKSVGVERLQQITEADAMAEGAPRELSMIDSARLGATASHKSDFQRLWDSLNSKRGFGWDTNPWVWVIEFERVEPKP